MTTIHTKVRNGLVTTALAGCVVLVSAPAYGAVAPEPDQQPVVGGQLSKAAIEHHESVTGAATGVSSSVPGVLSAQTKAQIEHLEATQRQGATTAAPTGGSSSDGDSNVLVTVLALLGGGLITGAAGSYTVSRMRQSGGPSPRTA